MIRYVYVQKSEGIEKNLVGSTGLNPLAIAFVGGPQINVDFDKALDVKEKDALDLFMQSRNYYFDHEEVI